MFKNQKINGNIRWNGGKIKYGDILHIFFSGWHWNGDPVGPHKNGPLVHPLIPTFTSNAQ